MAKRLEIWSRAFMYKDVNNLQSDLCLARTKLTSFTSQQWNDIAERAPRVGMHP